MRKWGKITLVIFGALVITALGIDAADTLSGRGGTLLSRVIQTTGSTCGEGMVSVENHPTLACVDMYEASPGADCPVSDPQNIIDSHTNIEETSCVPLSQPDVLPWRYVSRDQAMQACARAEKRLPTSAEWYALALGMTKTDIRCNVNSQGPAEAGSYSECASPHGAFDLVGNVWEWVLGDVIDGTYEGRMLPGEGYVEQVDGAGMATRIADEPSELFGSDYFWSRNDGAYAIIRGGFYGSKSDAGLYAVHADVVPTTVGVGIGFRCVK